MTRLEHKKISSQRRASRVAARVHGTAERPRLAVYISNMHVSAQLIDDDKRATLASASTVGAKLKGNMSQKAEQIGKDIAAKAKKAKIKKLVFDRSSKQYHGRVKALADAARLEGMEF